MMSCESNYLNELFRTSELLHKIYIVETRGDSFRVFFRKRKVVMEV